MDIHVHHAYKYANYRLQVFCTVCTLYCTYTLYTVHVHATEATVTCTVTCTYKFYTSSTGTCSNAFNYIHVTVISIDHSIKQSNLHVQHCTLGLIWPVQVHMSNNTIVITKHSFSGTLPLHVHTFSEPKYCFISSVASSTLPSSAHFTAAYK